MISNRPYRVAGFSFQDPEIEKVQVTVEAYLERFRAILDDFAEQERLALRLLSGSDEEKRSLDRGQISKWSGNFWQSRQWFFDLMQVVPLLVLELLKFQPPNLQDLTKINRFYSKPFRWSPKSYDPDTEVSKKYLSVLKELRGQLKACQKAAASIGTQGVQLVSVGKFELYNSVSGADTKKAEAILKQTASAMSRIGLGAYCHGKVVLVTTSQLAKGSSAFYVKNTDEIFLSPDVQGGEDVRALCHEIAHRVYVVLNLRHAAANLYADVREKDAWVTDYAKTDPEENFCELVSFAAIGRLPSEAKALLGQIPVVKTAYSYDRSMP